mmetsp:Transcript_45604/g.108419  ORF Transcript_45604/g.108419 Transcript_45604/m.108419 type:complete len:121 (+) Transcript_45604:125-487(+)
MSHSHRILHSRQRRDPTDLGLVNGTCPGFVASSRSPSCIVRWSSAEAALAGRLAATCEGQCCKGRPLTCESRGLDTCPIAALADLGLGLAVCSSPVKLLTTSGKYSCGDAVPSGPTESVA